LRNWLASLFLRLDSDATYEESHFTLHQARRLPFVSDGIVETKNAAGEPFAFDRVLEISDSGAEAIAQAAINFGQDDDITVLTFVRLAVQEHAAARQSEPAILPSPA